MFTDVREKAAQLIADNATVLLTAGGVVGTVATAVLAGRAGYKFNEVVRNEQKDVYDRGKHFVAEPEDIVLSTTTKLKLGAPWFIPPTITGAATISAIIFSHKMSAQKAAALAAAYGLAERNLADYKDKVTEKLTGPKKQAIDDELAQDSVDKTPGADRVIFVEGEVLCFDKPTGRYFNSTMETIKQAVNKTNNEIFNHGFTTVNFFYDQLKLEPTTWSGEVGFDTDNILELTYTTILANGRPCIALDFVRLPKADFDPKYR